MNCGVRLITLTTDFGTRDWFAGTLKGVIARINPRAAVVDLTHDVPPGDLRAGAFALAAACRYFPRGTIHVAIVDPGVGGAGARPSRREPRTISLLALTMGCYHSRWSGNGFAGFAGSQTTAIGFRP